MVKLTQDELSLLIKTLASFAFAYTDIKIVNNEIFNKTNDAVVTFNLKFPFQENLNIEITDIPSFVKILKGFADSDVIIEEDQYFYTFSFPNNVKFQFRKADLIINPFNKDKVETLLKSVDLKSFDLDVTLFDKVRQLTHKFSQDLLVNLEDGHLEIKSKNNNINFTVDLPVSSEPFKFYIIQNAFPPLTFIDKVTLSYGALQVTSGAPTVLYKIDTFIDINKHTLPFSMIGVSSNKASSVVEGQEVLV